MMCENGTKKDTFKYNNGYYDGTKLLSLLDINGEKPELYLCTTNRSAGKTTYFSRLCVNKFLKKEGKFGLLYRYKYELDDCANKFFRDISTLFFDGMVMTSKPKAAGIYHELYLNETPCGYAISLNSADTIKKNSHLFSDINRIFFDEFQSETNHYCADEIRKFISVHMSIARGQKHQSRYVPVYMCSNAVSIINPYYTALGVSERLQDNTKFLRGNGFVLENGFVESAANAIMGSGFNKAFSNEHYVAYSAQSLYLNDNHSFIEKPHGSCHYTATLRYNGVDYGIKEYDKEGIIYCDDKADMSCPLKITVTTDDHQINYVMLKRNDFFINTMRWYFERGCFRFKNLSCKEAVLKALSY